MRVSVYLKVLLPVNEEFELRVLMDYDNFAETVNPFDSNNGDIINKDFYFRKQLNKKVGKIRFFVDGKEIDYFDCATKKDFEVNGISFRMIKISDTQLFNDRDFYIGETPVTQELWNSVMGNVPLTQQKFTLFPHNRENDNVFQLDANKPIVNISLGDIENFIRKLNRKSGKHFRLPSYLEWELAALGDSDGFKNLDETAWHLENSNGELHDVATKMPNTNGIFDMIGNVWELTNDSFIRGGDYSTYILGDLPIEEYDVLHYSCFVRKAIGFRLVLSNDDSDTNMDFVDLGLSVLWESGSGKKQGGRKPS